MRWLLVLFLGSCVFADSPSWTLGESEGWNSATLVKIYFHNSELQRQWAWELLGKQSFEGSEKILDFGCGDGKISAELSRFVPQGGVVGVDISPEMVNFAKLKFPPYAYPNLEIRKSDSLVFDSAGQHNYDMICSFCVFHVVSEPLTVLKNLKTHLKPNGKLVLVIPAGRNPAFFTAANEIFANHKLDPPWKNQTPPTNSMRTLEGCSALLKEAGYQVHSLAMIDTDNPFIDKEELIAWMIGSTTANWNIPFPLAPTFFSELVDRMLELDPNIIDEEGRLHFKLSRIHAVASI